MTPRASRVGIVGGLTPSSSQRDDRIRLLLGERSKYWSRVPPTSSEE